MVFWSSWAKKVRESVSKLTFDKLKNRVDTIENKYVKKDENNTLTQTNTFNGITNFKSRIEFRNPNNNGAYLDNFDYGNQNYTAFKLVKGSTNMLQIEVNNDANSATISSPNTNNGLHINNLANPTNNDNATNKGYVDGLYNPLNTKVESVIRGLQNGNIINYEGVWSNSKTYHLAQAITYQGDWFVSTTDNNLNHTPNKNNTNYWVYISAPNVDLTQYLTISSANATYATQNKVNQLETHTTQTLNGLDGRITNNQNNISSLQSSKADLSYLNNNFYNKQQINSFNLTTLTGIITNIPFHPQNLGVGSYGIFKMSFETNITINPINWNEFAVIDFYFPNAVRKTTWIKPLFVNLANNKLGIEFLTVDENSYVDKVGTKVAIRVIKNQNYIG